MVNSQLEKVWFQIKYLGDKPKTSLFSNLREGVTDQAIFDTARAIIMLQDFSNYEGYNIFKFTDTAIYE